ncbi:hypothetical protein G5B39_13125 (plasmid) [Rhodobacteraceae bacterium SC52]|nr:hypothetical protein G5B39_13125 [Rhodobacteraceae bacterium SC52]
MTKRPNEKNERLKRRFIEYRKYARQLSDKTLDRELAALERFDVWNARKDFSKFHIEWAMGVRTHLEQAKSASGNPLGKSTTRAILATLRSLRCGFLSKMDFAAESGPQTRITSTCRAAMRRKPGPPQADRPPA